MNTIKIKFSILIKVILLGILFILFLIFSKNIERILLVCITIFICSLFQEEKFDLNFLNTIIIGLIIGITLGNLTVFWYIKNKENNIQEKNHYSTIKNNEISKIAVVLIAKGEPEQFNPIIILKDIYNNDNLVKKVLAPIDVFFHKLAYEQIGSSKFNSLCENLRKLLQDNLGYDYDVYITYTNTYPKLKDQMEKFSSKYDKIILAPLFLYETDEYIESMNYLNTQILYSETKLETTPLLWESEKLPKQIASKIANSTEAKNRSMTGIILIRGKKISNLNQEKEFLNKVIDNLKRYEFDSNKILISEANNLSKTIKTNVHSIQEKGISKIIIISTTNLMDDINTKRNINHIINDINEHVNIKYIDGWGIGEDLVNELEYKARIVNLKE